MPFECSSVACLDRSGRVSDDQLGAITRFLWTLSWNSIAFFPLHAICASRTRSDSYARNSSDFTADSEQLSTFAISRILHFFILVHHHRGALL